MLTQKHTRYHAIYSPPPPPPTATHALNGSAQISQCPTLPSPSNSLNLYINSSSHAFPVALLLNRAFPTTLTMFASASTMKASGPGNASGGKSISRIWPRSVKYCSQAAWPVKVLPRKGRRVWAQVGPCSVILGWEVKWVDRRTGGGGGEKRAMQKAWAWVRRVVLRSCCCCCCCCCSPDDAIVVSLPCLGLPFHVDSITKPVQVVLDLAGLACLSCLMACLPGGAGYELPDATGSELALCCAAQQARSPLLRCCACSQPSLSCPGADSPGWVLGIPPAWAG